MLIDQLRVSQTEERRLKEELEQEIGELQLYQMQESAANAHE